MRKGWGTICHSEESYDSVSLYCFGQQRVLICYLAVVQSRLQRVVHSQPSVVQKPVKLSFRYPISCGGGGGGALVRCPFVKGLPAVSESASCWHTLQSSSHASERLSRHPPV